MKYIIVTDEAYYPTVLVMDNEEHAKKIYEVLDRGSYTDWNDEEYQFIENFNVQMFCVENTTLKSQDWKSIDQLPIAQEMVFL
jgi:hypothetical protein